MNKLFSNFKREIIIAPIIVLSFFLPYLIQAKIPIPTDSLLGLYHPWRDNSYLGFSQEQFPTKNPLITDPVLQTYPWKSLVIENIKKLTVPHWNPYVFSGQPLLANMQSSVFQINNLLYFVLPFNVSWAANIVLTSVAFSIFMFLLLKSLNISTLATIFGSFTISFASFSVIWLSWGNILQTAVWLPLILFLINSKDIKAKAYFFPLLVFATFQVVVSGHIQTALYVLATCFIFSTYKAFKTKNFATKIVPFFGIVLGILISSIQLLPTLEFVNLSNRGADQSYFYGRQDWFIPLKHLIQILVPDFFGNPTTYNYFGVWNYAEFVSYIGIIPIYFAILGVIKKTKQAFFFVAMLIVSLIFAIDNPVSKLVYTLNIPFISTMQPSRLILLINFSLVVLAAYGVDVFIEHRKKLFNFFPLIIIFAVILATYYSLFLFGAIEAQNLQISLNNLKLPALITFVLLIIIVFNFLKLEKKFLFPIIVVFTIFELFRFSYKFTSFQHVSTIFPETKITNYLKNQEKPFRVITTDRRIMSPNSSTAYRIETVSGYDPLYLKSYAELISSFESGKVENNPSFNRIITPHSINNGLINLLNVKFVLSFDELSNDKFEKILEEGKTKLYVNKNYLPRFYFPDQVLATKNDSDTLNNLLKTQNFSKMSFSTQISSSDNNSDSNIKILSYSDNYISLETETSKDAYMFISNNYYPGWTAYVDGKKTPIQKANFTLQSLFIESGKHIVNLNYEPKSFTYGSYLSIIGVLLTLITTIFLWRRKLA